MDVLVPDTRSATAAEVVRNLESRGHRVHACVQEPAQEPCAQVSTGTCPLDAAPVDVAVAVGPPPDSRLADGAVCAARRMLPLVLVGAPADHPLSRWASARAGVTDGASAAEEVVARPLASQTDAASRALLHELRRQGSESANAAVAVYRRDGGLVVELRHDSAMSRTQAERLASQVARAVRRHDRWARDIEVTVAVREPEREELLSST